MIKKILKKIKRITCFLINKLFGYKNIIIFKGQSDFDGNAYALYKYLLENGYSNKYKFVWHVKNYKKYSNLICKHTDVIGYRESILKKIYYYSCAKYAFFDNECPMDIECKIKDVVYLTHGCPSIKNTKGIICINKTPTTHMLVTNETIRNTYSDMVQCPAEKIFVCGHPRNDIIFNEPVFYKDILGKKYSKVILWMPTFRKSNLFSPDGKQRIDSMKECLYGLPLVNSMEDLNSMNQILNQENMLLIIKTHPNADITGISELNFSNIIVWTQDYISNKGINMYALFGDTDALISDYSSVAFDFLLTNKPLGYVIDDMEDYKLGFAYDNILDYMPGEKIKSLSDFNKFLLDIANNVDVYEQERIRVNNWANKYHDGENCKRFIEIFDL